MVTQVGAGHHRYELVPDWAKIPAGWELGQVAPATDSTGRVYLFNRGVHPMMVMDTDGHLVDAWGEGVLTSAHGIYIDKDDNIYAGVMYSHVVVKLSPAGKQLLTLGQWDTPSNPDYRIDPAAEGSLNEPSWRPGGQLRAAFKKPITRRHGPFTVPTDIAIGPGGDIYCTDGYGNAAVHRFTSEGELRQSWGQPGEQVGGFSLPHGIWAHSNGLVYVCDRENNRVQIFDSEGHLQDTWPGFKYPCGIYIDKYDDVYVAEGVGGMRSTPVPERGDAFIQIRTLDGELITRFSGPTDAGAHAIWVDGDGSLYMNQNAFGPCEGQLPIVKYARL